MNKPNYPAPTSLPGSRAYNRGSRSRAFASGAGNIGRDFAAGAGNMARNAGESAMERMRGWNWRKIGVVAVAVGLLEVGLNDKQRWARETPVIRLIPSPSQVLEWAASDVAWGAEHIRAGLRDLRGQDSAQEAASPPAAPGTDAVATTTTSITVESAPTTVPGATTLPPLSVTVPTLSTIAPNQIPPPVAVETTALPLPTVATAAPVVAAPVNDLESRLPNPKQYSAEAGSVVCFGPVRAVTINAASEVPQLRQLQNATITIDAPNGAEPWAEAPQTGENPLDARLYAEVLMDSGFANGQPPAGDFEVYVRDDCEGLAEN